MKSFDTNRTMLYEKFHSFDKYHSGWYNRMHTWIRQIIRKVFPPARKSAY